MATPIDTRRKILPPLRAPANAAVKTREPTAEERQVLSQLEPIRVGSSGKYVVALRELLKKQGVTLPAKLENTELYDKAFEAVLRDFQQQKGCKVDGVVGQQTWGVLAGFEGLLRPGTDLLSNPTPAPAP